jgi:hypothetical protein
MLKVVNVKLQLQTEEIDTRVRSRPSVCELGLGLTTCQLNMFHVMKNVGRSQNLTFSLKYSDKLLKYAQQIQNCLKILQQLHSVNSGLLHLTVQGWWCDINCFIWM